MSTNFFAKEFRDFDFALGYADGYSRNPKKQVARSKQKKYDAGFELGTKDRKAKGD